MQTTLNLLQLGEERYTLAHSQERRSYSGCDSLQKLLNNVKLVACRVLKLQPIFVAKLERNSQNSRRLLNTKNALMPHQVIISNLFRHEILITNFNSLKTVNNQIYFEKYLSPLKAPLEENFTPLSYTNKNIITNILMHKLCKLIWLQCIVLFGMSIR